MMKLRKYGIVFLTLFFMVFTTVVESLGEEDYGYISFNNTQGETVAEVGIQYQHFSSTDNALLFENFQFLNSESYVHLSFNLIDRDEEALVKEARRCLLERGYAKLADESIALEYELDAQKKAQYYGFGIWNEEETAASISETTAALQESSDVSKALATSASKENTEKGKSLKWQRMIDYITDNHIDILSIIIPLFFGGGLLAYFIKRVNTRKLTVFIAGDTATGKSAFRKILLNPDLSTKQILFGSQQTRTIEEHRLIRDFQNERITLDAVLVDPPGGALSEVVDCLIKPKNAYAIVLILAPTREATIKNERQSEFIENQLQTIEKLWGPLLTSKSMVKPLNFIAFINKIDLYNDDDCEAIFIKHTAILRKACNEKRIPFNVISGSVVERIGVDDVLNILKKQVNRKRRSRKRL